MKTTIKLYKNEMDIKLPRGRPRKKEETTHREMSKSPEKPMVNKSTERKKQTDNVSLKKDQTAAINKKQLIESEKQKYKLEIQAILKERLKHAQVQVKLDSNIKKLKERMEAF